MANLDQAILNPTLASSQYSDSYDQFGSKELRKDPHARVLQIDKLLCKRRALLAFVVPNTCRPILEHQVALHA
ncbi:MAG TPA: hypothetical protein VGK24_00325 [Candidatus Angelobacter sp.]